MSRSSIRCCAWCNHEPSDSAFASSVKDAGLLPGSCSSSWSTDGSWLPLKDGHHHHKQWPEGFLCGTHDMRSHSFGDKHIFKLYFCRLSMTLVRSLKLADVVDNFLQSGPLITVSCTQQPVVPTVSTNWYRLLVTIVSYNNSVFFFIPKSTLRGNQQLDSRWLKKRQYKAQAFSTCRLVLCQCIIRSAAIRQ